MKPTYLVLGALALAAFAWQGGSEWRSTFPVEKNALSAVGANPYFPLTPGLRLYYRHGGETVVTSVLGETRTIDGVETRVVEDRETHNGKLAELTRDYYAADRATNDVYYFGEDVDVYRNGKVTGHEGAWLSGVKGARFGLMLPAAPKPGQKFYQEYALGVAMDRAEVAGVDETVTVPAGTWRNCVHIKESTPLEPGTTHKWFAPGVGLVKDGDLVLVKIERGS